MGRRAQALLELALFAGLILMILLAALNYQRNLREQKLTDKSVFEQVKLRAFNNQFSDKDIDGDTWVGTGAIVSYSLNVDRQASRIFQGGQRRTNASSASVYYSGAEDPPDIAYNYYNNTDISTPLETKKIYFDRGNYKDPEDDLKLSTAEYISAAYPLVSTMTQGLFNIQDTGWWASWGGYLDLALRLVAYGILVAKYYDAMDSISKAENDRAATAVWDEQMGEWGWRVCDESHDGSALAGKFYVKEISPQVYDIETEETKSIDYDETQRQAPALSSTRTVTVGHNVERKIQRRYDATVPDPTGPLSGHTFEKLAEKDIAVDLSGAQSENWN